MIKRCREAMGWTQAQLAEKLGISQSGVCRLENGTWRVPLQIAKKLEALFNIEFWKFLDD